MKHRYHTNQDKAAKTRPYKEHRVWRHTRNTPPDINSGLCSKLSLWKCDEDLELAEAASRPESDRFEFDPSSWFVMYNVFNTVLFREIGSGSGSAEKRDDDYGDRFPFSLLPTCHDFNPTTRTSYTLEALVGFKSGAISLLQPFRSRNSKATTITHWTPRSLGRVTALKWVPRSDVAGPSARATHFIVAHANGFMYVYDTNLPREKFSLFDDLMKEKKSKSRKSSASGSNSARDVLQPTRALANSFSVLNKEGTNPVELWQLPSVSVVNDLSFSHCGRFLSTVQEDGMLRVFDFARRELLVSFQSYFGGLTCVSYSPSDNFILTGGEDDIVTLWDPYLKQVVARCQGHRSFVSSVTFQPQEKPNHYKFVSVGQDALVKFWSFEDVNFESKEEEDIVGSPLFSASNGPPSLGHRNGSVESGYSSVPVTPSNRSQVREAFGGSKPPRVGSFKSLRSLAGGSSTKDTSSDNTTSSSKGRGSKAKRSSTSSNGDGPASNFARRLRRSSSSGGGAGASGKRRSLISQRTLVSAGLKVPAPSRKDVLNLRAESSVSISSDPLADVKCVDNLLLTVGSHAVVRVFRRPLPSKEESGDKQ